MRTIDADALRAEFKTPTDWFDSKQVFTHVTGIWATIDNAPTIEPERKKGKWIRWHETKEDETGTEYIPHCRCSECGTEYDPYSSKFVSFCNVCGAKMEEGGQDEQA